MLIIIILMLPVPCIPECIGFEMLPNIQAECSCIIVVYLGLDILSHWGARKREESEVLSFGVVWVFLCCVRVCAWRVCVRPLLLSLFGGRCVVHNDNITPGI